MMKDRKERLKETFEEGIGRNPDNFFDRNVSERDLEKVLRLNRQPLYALAATIKLEKEIDDLDTGHLSEASEEKFRQVKRKMMFNKAVQAAHFDMKWSKLRDLFVSNRLDELEDNYSDDLTDLQKYHQEVKDNDEQFD